MATDLNDVNKLLADTGVDGVVEVMEGLRRELAAAQAAAANTAGTSANNEPSPLTAVNQVQADITDQLAQLQSARVHNDPVAAADAVRRLAATRLQVARLAERCARLYANAPGLGALDHARDLLNLTDGEALVRAVAGLTRMVDDLIHAAEAEEQAARTAQAHAAEGAQAAPPPESPAPAPTTAPPQPGRAAAGSTVPTPPEAPSGPVVSDAYGAAGQVVVDTVADLQRMVVGLVNDLAKAAVDHGDADALASLENVQARMAAVGKAKADALSVDELMRHARRSATAAADVARLAATAAEADTTAAEYMARIDQLRTQVEHSDRVLRAGASPYVETGSVDAAVVARSIDALVRHYRTAGDTLVQVLTERGPSIDERLRRLAGDVERIVVARNRPAAKPVGDQLLNLLDEVDRSARTAVGAGRSSGAGGVRAAVQRHRLTEQAVADVPELDRADPVTWRAAVTRDAVTTAARARASLDVARRVVRMPSRTPRFATLVVSSKEDMLQQLRAVATAINAQQAIDPEGEALQDLRAVREELLDAREALEQANKEELLKRSVDAALSGATAFTGFLAGVLGMMGVRSLLDVSAYIGGGVGWGTTFGKLYYGTTLTEAGVGAQYDRARARSMLTFGRELFAVTNGRVDPTKPLAMRNALLRGVGGQRGSTPDQAAADVDTLVRELFAYAEVEGIDQGTLSALVKSLYKDADQTPAQVVTTVRRMTAAAKKAGVPTAQFMRLAGGFVAKMRDLGVTADVAMGTVAAMMDIGMRTEDAFDIVERTAQVKNSVFQVGDLGKAAPSVVFGHMAGLNPGNPWANILTGMLSHDAEGDPIKGRYGALGKMMRAKYRFVLSAAGSDAAGYANVVQQLMRDGYSQKQAAQITSMMINGDDEDLGELLEGIDAAELDDQVQLTGTAEEFTRRLAKASEQLGFAQKIEADQKEFMQWVGDLITNDLAPAYTKLTEGLERLITDYLVPAITEGLDLAKAAYERYLEFRKTPLGSAVLQHPLTSLGVAGGLLTAGGVGTYLAGRSLGGRLDQRFGTGTGTKVGGRAGLVLGTLALGTALYGYLTAGSSAEAAERAGGSMEMRQALDSIRADTEADEQADTEAVDQAQRTKVVHRWRLQEVFDKGAAVFQMVNANALLDDVLRQQRTPGDRPALINSVPAGTPVGPPRPRGFIEPGSTLATMPLEGELHRQGFTQSAATALLSALGVSALAVGRDLRTPAQGQVAVPRAARIGGRAGVLIGGVALVGALAAGLPKDADRTAGDQAASVGLDLVGGVAMAALAAMLARRGQGGRVKQVLAAVGGGSLGTALAASAKNLLGVSDRERTSFDVYVARLRTLDLDYAVNVEELVDAEGEEGEAIRRIFSENQVDYATLTNAQKANVQLMLELLAKGLLNYRQVARRLRAIAAEEGGTVDPEGNDVELSDELKQELYTQATEQILTGGEGTYDVNHYRLITAQAAYNHLASKKFRDADDEEWMRRYAFTVDYYKQLLGERDDGSPYTKADYLADIRKQAEYDVAAGWRPEGWSSTDEPASMDAADEAYAAENGDTQVGDDPEALGMDHDPVEAWVAMRARELEQEKRAIATSDDMLQVLRQKRYEARRAEYVAEHPQEVKKKGTKNPSLGKGGGALAAVPYKEWRDEILRRAAEYGVDPKLMAAIMYTESHFDPNATSGAGAMGLAQFMPDTARSIGFSPEEMYDPLKAIHANAMHLRALQDTFGNDYRLIAAAYNAGAGAVKDHDGIPPYRETQDYVRKVLAAYGGDVPTPDVNFGKASAPDATPGYSPIPSSGPVGDQLASAQARYTALMDHVGANRVTGRLVDNLWVIPEGAQEAPKASPRTPLQIVAGNLGNAAVDQGWARNEQAMRVLEHNQRTDNRRLSRDVDIDQAVKLKAMKDAADRQARSAAEEVAKEQAAEAEDARTMKLTINGQLRPGFTNRDLEEAVNEVLRRTAMEIETEYVTM